jgi:2-oxoisovalerate dehydrogenase E2 component (dihydrolipoyl transacylase)
MPTEQIFKLPDLGEGLTEAEISGWLVAVGQNVAMNDPLVAVETAKATVEIPSPFAGTVLQLYAADGDVVAVGSPLISIGTADKPEYLNQVAGQQPTASASGEHAPIDLSSDAPARILATQRPEADEPSGNVLVGYGTRAQTAGRRRRADLPQPIAAPTVTPATPLPPKATPPVRKLAKTLGVDLAALTVTGPVISRQDVLDAAQAATSPTDTPSLDESAIAVTPPRVPASGVIRTLPMKGLRKAIATNVTRSRHDVPEATAWLQIDVTDLWSLRRELNEMTGVRISPLAIVCRAVTAALSSYPVLNSRLDDDGEQIQIFDHVHLGLAASTDRGLIVPVIRNAHRLSILRLAEELNRITDQARAGVLAPVDLTGSTFTVNNYGVLGVDGGNPIINHPEAAILGIGRVVDKPWVHGGAVVARKVTELVLAFDHRICDGREAGGFLRLVADMLEDPRVLTVNL